MQASFATVLDTVPDTSLRARARLWQRWTGTPMRLVSAHVPREGQIVDLGCGFGLFAAWLALEAPTRRVWGVDMDGSKITRAQHWFGHLDNVRFALGDLETVTVPPCDAVVIYDVLHHLRPEAAEALLSRAWSALRPGGLLVVKENDTSPPWKHWLNQGIEVYAHRSGLTHGEPATLRSLADWQRRVAHAGFRVRHVGRLDAREGFFVPHGLLIGERT